jgi:hypothetical protein
MGFVIKEDADYEGVRITFRGTLQNMRIPMQIDIGFGDIVFPAATITAYPTILNHSAPMLRAYSRETVVTFLKPLAIHISQGQTFSRIWRAPGPWT